jgi:hypothetical protein
MSAAVQVAGEPALWFDCAGWLRDAWEKPDLDAEECLFAVA